MVDMYARACWILVLSIVCFTEVNGTKNACPVSWRRDRRHIAFRNQCFLFSRDLKTWISASVTCSRKGGNLVAIADQTTQRFVVSGMKRFGLRKAWIGANDRRTEGRWFWTTGTAVKYSNWGSFYRRKRFIGNIFHDIGNKIQNQFNSVKNNARNTLLNIPNHLEDCAYVKMADRGRWHDAPCAFGAFRLPYICQSRNKPSTNHIPGTQKPHKRPSGSSKTTTSSGKSFHKTRPPQPPTKRPHLPVQNVTPRTTKPYHPKSTFRPVRYTKVKSTKPPNSKYRSTPKLPDKLWTSQKRQMYPSSERSTKEAETFTSSTSSRVNATAISSTAVRPSGTTNANLAAAFSHWIAFKKTTGFAAFTESPFKNQGESKNSLPINAESFNPFEGQNVNRDPSVIGVEHSNPLAVQTGDSESLVTNPKEISSDGQRENLSIMVDTAAEPGSRVTTQGGLPGQPSGAITGTVMMNIKHQTSDLNGDNKTSTKELAVGLSVGAAAFVTLGVIIVFLLKRRHPKSDEEQVAMAFDNQVYGTPTVTSSCYDVNSMYITPCTAVNDSCS